MPVTTTDIIERGDTRTLAVALTVAGAATDPATLTLTIRTPAGVSTTHTYGSSAIVRDSTGNFHFDLTFTESGAWTYEWRSTVPTQVQGAVIEVQPSPIDDAPVTLDPVALGAFRLELGDLADDQLFTDEQAQYFVDKHPTNLLLAVADGADALAARFAREFDFATTSEKRFDAGQKVEHYLAIGKRLRDRATAEGDGSGTATLTATDGQIVRVLKATAARVTTTFEANDVPTNATGDVSVAITREDGTAVRTATAVSTTVTGQYYVQITPTDTAALDVLKLTWTATIAGGVQEITTYVEVRGARLFSIAQARRLRPLDNATAFPTARLVEARTLAEIALERACDRVFAPTYFRATLNGADRVDLALPVTDPLTFTAATVDGTAIDESALIPFGVGRVYREAGWTAGVRNVVIAGTHGYRVPPPEVSAACVEWAHAYLVGGGGEPDPADLPKCAAVIDRYGMTASSMIA